MKMKSLLFAAAAMLSLGASAQYIEWTGKIESSEGYEAFKPGELVSTGLVLTEAGNLPNFTNFEAHFTLPDGIALDFVDVSDDTKAVNDKGRTVQPLGWAYNTKEDTGEGVIIGSNANKVKITTQDGMEICVVDFVVADDFEGGDIEMFGTKAVTYENDTYEMPRFTLVSIPGSDIPIAVNDVNVNKTVSSVKYYNAAGVAADSAFDGVNIVVTKYADGSQKVSKVVK